MNKLVELLEDIAGELIGMPAAEDAMDDALPLARQLIEENERLRSRGIEDMQWTIARLQSRLSAAERELSVVERVNRHNLRIAEERQVQLKRAEEVVEVAKYVLNQAASEWPDLRDAIGQYEQGYK